MRRNEARIQALCTEAINAEHEAEVDRILSELRAALTEHIQGARRSLTEQAILFTERAKIRN